MFTLPSETSIQPGQSVQRTSAAPSFDAGKARSCHGAAGLLGYRLLRSVGAWSASLDRAEDVRPGEGSEVYL